jgi:DNA replication protein DnaC
MEKRTGQTEIKKVLTQQFKSTPAKVWVSSDGKEVTLTQEERGVVLMKSLDRKIETNPDDPNIDLTEDETAEALEIALHQKIGLINIKLYENSIFNPQPQKAITAEEMYKMALRIGKSLVKQKDEKYEFYLLPEEKKIYGLLALYFSNDKRFESYGYSLRKGICLYGNVGCGKTTALEVFRTICNITFPVLTCEEIVREYSNLGAKIIDKYINYRSICLDDLGTEPSAKYMGNESNVIREIINGRYNKEKNGKFLTHITTNLTVKQIKQDYGERFGDRCRELFNQIEFPIDSESKR